MSNDFININLYQISKQQQVCIRFVLVNLFNVDLITENTAHIYIYI